MRFSLLAPAKINRFLQITGRREDGYHDLQTLYQFIDFADKLTFETREDGDIVLLPDTLSSIIPTEHNLVYRAAKRLQAQLSRSSRTLGATITLKKRLPLGSGLGGGSSNAATTLIGLEKLWGHSLSVAERMAIGKTLGADVPIFLLGKSAWGEGIGDVLTPVALDEPWIVLLHPHCEVDTRKMFALPELTRNSAPFTISTLSDDEINFIAKAGKNDFEPVVCQRFDEVAKAMKWLSNFGRPQLSGSGATVYLCFEEASSAQAVLEQLPSGVGGRVVKALNNSPLFPVEGCE